MLTSGIIDNFLQVYCFQLKHTGGDPEYGTIPKQISPDIENFYQEDIERNTDLGHNVKYITDA